MIQNNRESVFTSFGIQTNDDELDFPYIYWIPKMHKNPYKVFDQAFDYPSTHEDAYTY